MKPIITQTGARPINIAMIRHTTRFLGKCYNQGPCVDIDIEPAQRTFIESMYSSLNILCMLDRIVPKSEGGNIYMSA